MVNGNWWSTILSYLTPSSIVKKKFPEHVSVSCVELVKRFEGFEPNAYVCPAGEWTIGYGHTEGVYNGQQISYEDAEDLLINDLTIFESVVKLYVKVFLNQNQFDSLVSWTFNLGEANLKFSTLLKVLNKKNYDEVPNQMKRWIYADGIIWDGLIDRRKIEADLWSS